MSRIVWNTTGQAVSSLSGSPVSYEVVEGEPERSAWKSEECSSDVLTDTDSYQTADDDDRNISTDADVDPLISALQVPDLQHPVDNAERRQGSLEFESSSSSEEDDSRTDIKVTADDQKLQSRRSEPEKRRRSYQFAISTSERLTPDVNDDDVINDLDPVEFRHHHMQETGRGDEESDTYSDCLPDDLDPREFTHPSMQPPQLTLLNQNIVVDGKARHGLQNHSNTGLSKASLHEGSSEALQLSNGCSEVCCTERHESVVEGNLLPSIIIPSPTEKILDIDHQECFVVRTTKRVMFDFSLALQHLPLFIAGEKEVQLSSQASTLVRDSPGGEKRVSTILCDGNGDDEPLPVVEAIISETTELIRARLIETAALWESFQYDDMNLSSSPEKYSGYPFDTGVPPPDYEPFTSSSSCDTSFEVGDDVAAEADVHSDEPSHNVDRSRSPTPDYDMLSPIYEQDMAFTYDSSGHTESDQAAAVRANFTVGEVHDDRNDEIRVHNDVKEFGRHVGQPLLLARKGSQRFSKPVQRSAVTVEPELTEQADEDEAKECEQNDGVVISGEMHEERHRSDVETAPVAVSANDRGTLWQSQAKSQMSSGDQPNVYTTLGSTSDKRKRISKRSVVMTSCSALLKY